MGEVIRIKCNDCNTFYDLQTGHGMKDNDPSNFISFFPDNRQLQINSIISSNVAWDFSHMSALCGSCRSYTTVPVFASFGDDPVSIVGTCACGDDGNDAVITDIDSNTELKCPKCGGSVTVEHTGMWD